MRSGRSSRVRPLRSLGLLFVRKGMLRAGTLWILLRLSPDSFMPKLCTNRAPNSSSRVSPGASPLCGVATSSTEWHAPGHGARALSLHFGAKFPKCRCRRESGVGWWCQRALASVIGRLGSAAEVRVYADFPLIQQPFWDVESVPVSLAPAAEPIREDIGLWRQL